MSKEYQVLIPIAGCIAVTVEAENEEEAKEKAFEEDWAVELSGPNVELHELEPLEKIVEGNVCYAPQWYVEVEEC